MSGIQAKQIAGYVILPGIMPRLKNLFTSGFDYIAFLIAQIYAMVRLLPPNHAYLNPQNIGKYTIRAVIAQAANHIELKKENADQILIFGIILTGLILLIIQFAMIFFTLILEPAMAAFPAGPHPTGMSTGGSLFITAEPTFDIAFMLLDQVFGIPGLYESCIEQNISCATAGTTIDPTPLGAIPWPFHDALHQLFRFYNTGILVIGALIFLYFVLIVVGETAVTGTPFGQRFQNVWVPIRLVMALGLLVPLNFGMNSGQYITLFAAKYGSSFATNVWTVYNNTIRTGVVFPGGDGANPLGERESVIGNPRTPDVSPILEAMSIVQTCAMSYWYMDATDPKGPTPPNYDGVQAYLYKEAPAWMPNSDNVMEVTAATSYADALDFYNSGDIAIRFGIMGDTDGDNMITDEEVEEATCGEVTINIHTVDGSGVGAEEMQEYYFNLIRWMWFTASAYEMKSFAYRFALLSIQNTDAAGKYTVCSPPGGSGINTNISGRINGADEDECNGIPEAEWRALHIGDLEAMLTARINTIWGTYAAETDLYEMNQEILQRGWAGAGIWYNTISRVNGNFMSAVNDIPTMTKYPMVMIITKTDLNRENNKIENTQAFCPNDSNSNLSTELRGIGMALCKVHRYWNKSIKNAIEDEATISGSGFEDAMHLIFGTHALSSMRAENNTTHPLAQLAMLGKGLVDASIRNVATASATSALGGIALIIDKAIPAMAGTVADFILSTAFVGLTAGLVLYYIVPFLPFIYFFFAVASWVKSIFEAMVGVPLWALAHLRIDGEGLPGTSAANGYFLIFEIFLRPVLTIFGLIAATLIFTAQVRVLNFLWQIVTENLAGFDNDTTIYIAGDGNFGFKRNIVDQFFFSIIYAIIVYMMAIAAFKLIDKIPDNLLRWMGNSVSSFGDINQDSVDGLTRYAALGGATSGQRLAEGIKGVSGGVGQNMGGLLHKISGGPG